jgi:ABC-2 type transport system permease protein
MKAWVELYTQQFKTTLAMMFQYRASLFIWMLGQVLEPVVYLIVWTVVSNQSGGSVSGFTTADFASYFIILMLVNQFSYTWIMYEFEYRVREGTFSFALLKPVHPIHSDIADNISSKIITLPVMVVIAILLGIFFHVSISPALWAIILFLPSLLMAFLVRFIIEWTLSLAAFWTTRVSAINQTYFLLILFLSGQIAPLQILPQPVQILARVLPFYWTIGFPVEILLGGTTLAGTLIGIGVQVGWFAMALVLLRFIWRAGIKVYSAVGQ